MDRDYFIKEMHDYVDELYTEFIIYQDSVVTSLIEFDKVCRKHNIRYYLGFGSLLGFYRDGDNLPWDYDIDVVVPYPEKDHLIEALRKDMDEKYSFYCPEVDAKCRHYCMRITEKGYDSAAVHMDVFFLIGVPEDKGKREKVRKQIKKVNLLRKAKLMDVDAESMGVRVFKYAGMLKKFIYAIWYPLFLLNRKEQKLCNMIPLSEAKYVSTMQAAADTYTADVFQKPSEVVVRGVPICAPTDIVGFLNQTYKDYKGYPKISSRFEEFYSSYKRLKYFETRTKAISKQDYQINTY
ncbi:LicD family protein [bacterium 210820-DFI.6.37]|nr:LicD family protein [bacterium 210820-DFI.6.37]